MGLLGTLALAACGGSGEGEPPVAVGPTSTAVVDDVAEWQTFIAEIDRVERHPDAPQGGPRLRDIVATPGGFVAVGRDRGAFAVWSSTHGRRWIVEHDGTCCPDFENVHRLVRDGDQLVVFGSVFDEDNNRIDVRYASTDRGTTWAVTDHAPDPPTSDISVVRDIPENLHNADPDDLLAFPEPEAIIDDRSVQLADGRGQWGDVSGIEVHRVGSEGPAYGIVVRRINASLHACYPDPGDCQRWETALATSADGTAWFDVDIEPPTHDERLVVGDSGSLLLWRETEDHSIVIRYWPGPDQPPTVDPADPPVPDAPVSFHWFDEELPVGEERRYRLAVGGCSFTTPEINGQLFEPDADLLLAAAVHPAWEDDDPGADGPEGYLFDRILLSENGTLTFRTEDDAITATFHQIDELANPCS